MATIHPSRMGLIPQEMRANLSDRNRGRSPSPRRPRRSPSPRRSRSRDRERDRERERGRDGGKARDSGYDGDRRTGRGNSIDRGRDVHRDGHQDHASEPRRASPQYEDYKRPPPPAGSGESSAPWRQQDSMYPPKQNFQYQGGGSGGNFLEARRAQRAAQTVNVWPPSPKAPARDLSPKGKKSSKKSKRHRSPTPSDTDSEEEERRREKKERKRARKAREKEERKEKKKHHSHRSRSHHHHTSDEESDDDGHRHKHRSKRTRSRSPSRSRSKSKSVRARSGTPDRDRMEVDVVASKASPTIPIDPVVSTSRARHTSTGPPSSPKGEGESDSGDEVGPQPIFKKGSNKKFDERAYGGALLRGEGSAMAAFLQDGTESRIPRRGEIGLTSDEIAKYEDVGYVMSGSRHRRMNAVRMRKENQVISAEEKRGILKLQREERERKEAILRDEFSQLVNEKLKAN